MSSFRVACIHQSGQDMVVVPLGTTFGSKSVTDQQKALDGLRQCAAKAGLVGTVVPVWRDGRDMKFIAPRFLHAYFNGLSFEEIRKALNKVLLCGR